MIQFFKSRVAAVSLAVTFSVFGSGLIVSDVLAQTTIPQAKAAIVDVTFILNSSETWKNAEKEMKARVDDVQKEIDVKKEQLKVRADELKRQQTILAPDVFQAKAREIQKDQLGLQREAQISNAKVNDVLNRMRGQLRGVIVKLAANVAAEKGMNIGFDRNNVIFFNDGMDITKEVLKRFNASKTKVEITVDKNQ
ncbi:OmpH family outer membrane protein [Sneathiella sp.]|uniref:OmpH family outer membrane protein n=1 Tax=Sneathiella sp. TaxID=1964365 RepID=UPI0039E56C61